MSKKHSIFSFTTILFMPRLFEHERPGAFGMLKAGVHVSGIARYHDCHQSTIQRLGDRFQATGTVKDRRMFGQPRKRVGISGTTAKLR